MKKFFIIAVLVCTMAAFAFADANFTVQTVTGSVTRELGNQTIAIKEGDILPASTVVKTNAGASLVVRADNGRIIRITESQNGTVAELIRPGVRIGGNVSQTDTTAVTRTATGAGTASARASDAAGDDDIAAE